MKGSESNLWKTLKRRMNGLWVADRIEDMLQAGIPDISYSIPTATGGVHGWLELKHVKEWPKRPATPVKIGLSKAQFFWLNKRGKAAGHCYVLAQIEKDYLLFTYPRIPNPGATWNRADLELFAVAAWHNKIDNHALRAHLQYRYT